MGLLAAIARLITDGGAADPHFSKKHARFSSADERRRCYVEQLEPRQLLAGDIHLGSVYFEEATGDESDFRNRSLLLFFESRNRASTDTCHSTNATRITAPVWIKRFIPILPSSKKFVW